MSTSQHPVALRLERLVGGDAKLLALVMMLPLIDGVFPALILTGALNDPLGAIQVGLLIFGGSATTAVILAEMGGTPREQVAVVLLVGLPLILLAAVQAALAPAIGSVLDTVIFERFAAVVILAIAAKTASATIGDYLPSPGVIIGLGLVASLDPTGLSLTVMDDPALVANAALAAVSGVAFALGIAAGGPYLREYMDIDRFRFGSAVALGLLPLSLLGMAFGQAPLAALIVAAVFAVDLPLDHDESAAPESESESESGLESALETNDEFSYVSSPTRFTTNAAPAVGTGPLADGGETTSSSSSSEGTNASASVSASPDGGRETATESAAADEVSAAEEDSSEGDSTDAEDTDERAPWL